MLNNRFEYFNLVENLQDCPPAEQDAIVKEMAKTDLFFLCWFVLGWDFYNPKVSIDDYKHEFDDNDKIVRQYSEEEQRELYEDALKRAEFPFNFCKQVHDDPYQLWLVARGHMKSLTLTTAHNIQIILNNPNDCIAIMSYNMKTAKAFLRQIKQELEGNELLKYYFPEIFYEKPEKESIKWSEQDGLIVKRSVIRKEPTFYAFGLVDSQATGFHFDVHSFDDVVVQESVTSTEMIQKTTERWELSDNLGMMTERGTRKKYAGTRYHYFDTYSEIMKRGTPTTTIAATDNGELDGEPIFLTHKQLKKKLSEQGSYTFSAQNLLKPVSKDDQKIKVEKFKFYDTLPDNVYTYLAVDPANAKKKKSDYTAGLVFAVDCDGKVYVTDGVHDKLNLTERYDMLKQKNDRWQPRVVGYEKYGIQTDIDYFIMQNKKDYYHLPLFEMKGTMSKEDRILRLVALLENGDLYLPRSMKRYSTFHEREVDIVTNLLSEAQAFPFGEHDDLLDCLARCFDLFLNKPDYKPDYKQTEEWSKTAGARFERNLAKKPKRDSW